MLNHTILAGRRLAAFFVFGAASLASSPLEAGLCKQWLHQLGIKRPFYVKNPLADLGKEKLFPKDLVPNPGTEQIADLTRQLKTDGKLDDETALRLSRALAETTDHQEALERLRSYLRQLHWWNFMQKDDRDEILLRADQAIGLLDRNPFNPAHAMDVYKKPAHEVTLHDAVDVLDPDWNRIDSQTLRSSDVRILHPYAREAARWGKWLGVKTVGIATFAVFFSMAYAGLESLNSSWRETQVGEVRRMSFATRHGDLLADPKNSVSPEDRAWLTQMYDRKNVAITDFQAESRWEMVNLYTTLSMADRNLRIARDELKSEEVLGIHLRYVYTILALYPDFRGTPQGEDIRTYAESLIETFDPSGKFQPKKAGETPSSVTP